MAEFPILREPLLRLIRVIKAEPPPVQWALAVAYKHTGDRA